MNKLSLVSAVLAGLLLLSLLSHAQDRATTPGGSLLTRPSAVDGPQALTYVVSGVADNGAGNNTGVATVFHCTNASTAAERVRFDVRSAAGVLGTGFVDLPSGATVTAATHPTNAYVSELPLSPGIIIQQGFAMIFSTTQFMFCSAMTIDASTAAPVGVALHMVRFNALAGTQE